MKDKVQYLPHRPGDALFWMSLLAAVLCIGAYVVALRKPENRVAQLLGRLFYAISGVGFIGASGYLAYLVYARKFEFKYVWEHTGTDISFWWFRLAATWSGQEGSFALWGLCTAIIGFLVVWKAGRYEARVMPFYVSVLGFLAAILIRQSPFLIVPPPSAAELAANPSWHYPPLEGQGLNPSLQNYWMTIHPPTIFFGFASLTVPYVYAIAAILWRDYDRWVSRVMPYALLSTATLGVGLFMGGYWAYETQGWHGFWAWDPVENASFFPWLAITALAHGLVVQKYRGGMVRTNLFLAILSFSLFLVGTFLTRSGALAQEDANGQLLSVHAFANLAGSALAILNTMLAVYWGGGTLLWLVRLRSMPVRPTLGDRAASRDLAMFFSVMLMIVACFVVAFGTTTPLFRSWLKMTPWQPKAAFYNTILLPIALLVALGMGVVPWLAWRRTNPDAFLRKLLAPWILMLAFGFFMVFWVQGAQTGMQAIFDANDPSQVETLKAWKSLNIQRLAVVTLTALGFLAALSNAMLGYRVFRSKPLSAGGWLAHVGIGLMILGIAVSNTFERTQRLNLMEGSPAKEVFGYKIAFEKMTGRLMEDRPLNPDYDMENAVRLRVTPPNADSSASADGTKTFLVEPRWFVHNKNRAPLEDRFERMRWPSIQKYFGHDLYVGLANDPAFIFPSEQQDEQGYTFKLKEKKRIGPYMVGYFDHLGEPGKFMGAHFVIATPENKVVQAFPVVEMSPGTDAEGKPSMSFTPRRIAIPELKDENGVPGVIMLDRLDPGSKTVTVRISLPNYNGRWMVPLEVTFKPWINLVWLGVTIAAIGTLLAMLRRSLDARSEASYAQNGLPLPNGLEGEEEEADAPALTPVGTPVGAATLQDAPLKKPAKRRKALKPEA